MRRRFPRTEREEVCFRVFSRVSGPCVKATTVVVCSSGCVVVVYSVGAREMGLVGVGAVLQFVLTLRTGPYRSVPLAAGLASRSAMSLLRHLSLCQAFPPASLYEV